MSRIARIGLLASLSLAVAAVPQAMAARGGPPNGAPGFRGAWHPVVGSGAAYRLEQKGQPAMEMEIAVVGQEEGGYWVETRMFAPEEMISKALILPGQVKRTIVKAAGQPAMELPAMNAPKVPETDIDKTAKRVGTETIATPAGSFACDHYQSQESGGTVDVWVATKVSPYGLVKMASPGTTMVISKLITGAKSRITETPQKLDIPSMPSMEEMMKQMKENQ